LAGEKHES